MYLGREDNEQGTGISIHKCETCGEKFTLCPAVPEDAPGWENCMDYACASYDPDRDADILFMSAAEIARERKVVSFKKLQERSRLWKKEG